MRERIPCSSDWSSQGPPAFFSILETPEKPVWQGRAFAMLHFWKTGKKNEFRLQGLVEVWKQKYINIVLSYLMRMSTFSWVCHGVSINIYLHTTFLWLDGYPSMFVFSCISRFPSPPSYSCPNQGNPLLSTHYFRGGIWGRKTDTASPTLSSGFCSKAEALGGAGF